jgi:hypothetical protein
MKMTTNERKASLDRIAAAAMMGKDWGTAPQSHENANATPIGMLTPPSVVPIPVGVGRNRENY